MAELSDEINAFLASVFPNHKPEMYDGNMPAGKGHESVNGGYTDRWETKYGGGETYNGDISYATFCVDKEASIYIAGDCLQITVNKRNSQQDIWEYTNTPSYNLAWTVLPKHYHELEPEQIEKILDTKIENCKFWDMVQARAKELYANGIVIGGKL